MVLCLRIWHPRPAQKRASQRNGHRRLKGPIRSATRRPDKSGVCASLFHVPVRILGIYVRVLLRRSGDLGVIPSVAGMMKVRSKLCCCWRGRNQRSRACQQLHRGSFQLFWAGNGRGILPISEHSMADFGRLVSLRTGAVCRLLASIHMPCSDRQATTLPLWRRRDITTLLEKLYPLMQQSCNILPVQNRI